MLENLLEVINNNLGSLKPRDLGEYKVMKKGVMKFENEAYELDNARVSYMKMNAMCGLMKMETIVITPLTRDMPLMNFDVVKAMGNITFILEMYDVNLNKVVFKDEFKLIKDKYNNIPSYIPEANWYDTIRYPESVNKKGKKILEECLKMALEYLEKYISLFNEAKEVEKKSKAACVDEYVTKLIENGGVSTDQFIKLFGKEKTETYLKNYMFGSNLE